MTNEELSRQINCLLPLYLTMSVVCTMWVLLFVLVMPLLFNRLLCAALLPVSHREIHKTALGATDTVAWRHFSSTSEAVESLKGEGYSIYAIEQADQATSLEAFEVSVTIKWHSFSETKCLE